MPQGPIRDAATIVQQQNQVNVSPFGELSVQPTPQNLFHDTFDASPLNTIDLWQTPVASGAGSQIATVPAGGGQMTLSAGTAAGGYSYVSTKAIFSLNEPGFIEYCEAMKLPQPLPTNIYAAWGNFTPQAVPTVANPISEGTCIEIQPGGKMYIASYAGGQRTQIQDLSPGTGSNRQPLDGVTHSYYDFNRGDLLAWALDGIAAQNFLNVQNNGVNGPNVNSQPLSFLCVNGLTAPSSALVLAVAAAWVAATTANGWITDGVFGFRKATVKAAGIPPSVSDTTVVTASSPFNYTHIAAGQVATVIKSGAGVLHSITFNGGATTGAITTIYDNTSAATPVIGVATPLTGAAPSSTVYDIAFTTGLTIACTGGNNSSDMTIAWK